MAKYDRLQNGAQVRLTETPYGSTHEGTLVLSEQMQSSGAMVPAYGVWTIRHDDGSLFRAEGRLEAI